MANNLSIRDPWLLDIYKKRDEFLGPLTQQFDKFFNEFWQQSSLSSLKASAGFPKLNISEENDELIVRAAVPGMTADDLKVELFNQTLRISGQMSESYSSPEKDTTFFVRELKQSFFSREITLPEYATGDPETSLKDGLLTLKWIKPNPDNPVVKQIKIN